MTSSDLREIGAAEEIGLGLLKSRRLQESSPMDRFIMMGVEGVGGEGEPGGVDKR